MSEVIRLRCNHCAKGLNVPNRYSGRQVACPRCRGRFTVPEATEIGVRPDSVPAELNSRQATPAFGEWIAGSFPFVFGPIVIVYWAIRGNPKWKPLFGLTAASWALTCGVLYWQSENIAGFLVSRGTPRNHAKDVVQGDSFDKTRNWEAPGAQPDFGKGLLDELRRHRQRRRADADSMMTPPSETELNGMDAFRQRALRANVGIRSVVGAGSGVICRVIGDKALILTNRHVVDREFDPSSSLENCSVSELPGLKIHYVESSTLQGRVVWVADGGIDIALVEAACPPSGIAAADWKTDAKVSSFEEVYAVGNPVGLGWSYSPGHISAIRKRVQGQYEIPIYQIDASINRGNSGGGLYNKAGQLIGINTSIVNPEFAQRIGFAIRIDFLRELNPPGLTD